MNSTVSKRGNALLKESTPLVSAHFKCMMDSFHPTNNPNGYINFGTAENLILEERITHKIKEFAVDIHHSQIHYNYPHGSIELRKSLSTFANHFLQIELDPDLISIGSGSSSILEMLSFALCDQGDQVFIPAPFYTGFLHDFQTRFHAQVITCDVFENGKLNLVKLEDFLKEKKPKVFVLNNPHNPMGVTYSQSELIRIIEICKKLSIEIIADEIYANSHYDSNSEFKSILSLDTDYKQHIHWVFGLAKDFGLSGLKVGFFYSKNKNLSQVMQAQCYFHTVSGLTQHIATRLLDEHKFLEQLFEFNHKELQKRFELIHKFSVENKIPFIKSQSGIFAYLKFGHKSDMSSRQKEEKFYIDLFEGAKVNVTPAQFFGSENLGWFRLCFAQSLPNLEEGLKRLAHYLK